MLKIYKILFFNLMILGTLISISAYSWFSMWMGLEINLLSIIPLFKSTNNIFPAEASIKYFITQALASTMILFSITSMMYSTSYVFNDYFLSLTMNSALLMKLGAAPFHLWFPEVSEGLNWMNNFLLMTWQKIAPSILIMYNFKMFMFFNIIIISNTIIGGIFGLNQTSLRKIMAYSSINHIAWILASMMYETVWLIYFIIYSIISFNIIILFYYLNIFKINQLSIILKMKKLTKLTFMMNFLSLGGLPPFLGFLPKWLSLNFMIYNNQYILSMILVIFTLITLFFYLRLMLSSLTLNFNEIIIYTSNFNQYILIFINIISLMSLIICINLVNFL